MRRAMTLVLALTLTTLTACTSHAGVSAGPPSTSPGATPRPHATLGLNVEPSYRPWRWAGGPNPDSWWDPATGIAKIDAEMPLIAQARAATVRVEFPWTFLETGKRAYAWDRADHIVATAAANHVEVRPIVVFCPAWQGKPNCVPQAADFRDFVTALATRYKGQIHAWEFGNEPDINRYFGGSEAQWIAAMNNPGYEAVKAVDPANTVVSAGMAYPTHLGWIDTLKANGARFDVQAYHDYPGSADQVNHDGWAIRTRMDADGFSAMPIWLDEYGIDESTANDTNQQAWMRTVSAAGANPAAQIVWYNLRDDFNYCGPTDVCNRDHYGLLQHDLTPKQGYDTFKALR